MSNKKTLTFKNIDGDGIEVKNINDNHEDVTLYPFETIFTVRLDNIRIQTQPITSMVGFAYMPVDSFKEEDGRTDLNRYIPHKTKYVNVSISVGEQEFIEKTHQEIGMTSINRNNDDMSANLAITIGKSYFDELYELVITRQLSALTLDIIFRDPLEKLYGVHKYNKNLDSLMPPLSYAVKNWCFPSGEVENIEFSTLPLPLNVDKWGYYGLQFNSYDAAHHSYEAYKEKKDKPVGIWMSLSSFERLVIGLLGLIFIGVMGI